MHICEGMLLQSSCNPYPQLLKSPGKQEQHKTTWRRERKRDARTTDLPTINAEDHRTRRVYTCTCVSCVPRCLSSARHSVVCVAQGNETTWALNIAARLLLCLVAEGSLARAESHKAPENENRPHHGKILTCPLHTELDRVGSDGNVLRQRRGYGELEGPTAML